VSSGRQCPSCGANAVRPLQRYAAARLVRCLRCGLVFAGVLPTAARLDEHYANYPPTGSLSALTLRRYGEVLDMLEQFRTTGRLLDVGCGDGHFLDVARQRGWHVYGSEYGEGPRLRARARGLDVRTAPFTATRDELASFDVITAFEVIEHMVDPRRELATMATLLRQGGALYLTTPNFDSLTRRLAGPRWPPIDYPEHLSLFTPQTLDALLSETGWTKLRLLTTGASPSNIWTGMKSVHEPSSPPVNPPGPNLDHRLRAGIASSPGLDRLLRAVNVMLTALGAGDTIKALYRR
jgi:SAM-dependent methyltransferase